MRRTPALIAGGGPAGAAAAILLARGGAMPVVIERNRAPQDIVCGGFLGGDAIALLRRIGVDPALLGARPIGRARLVAAGSMVETDLPFEAAGLSRRTLDTALLAQAEAQGAMVQRGLAIRRVDRATRCLYLGDGSAMAGDALFLATGKHDARGIARRVPPERDPALGLRIRLEPTAELSAALDGVIELHLFRDGYAGLLCQEDGSVNLCLSVAQSRLRAADGQPDRLIGDLAHEAPRLADRFGSATARGTWSSVARIPYGWRARGGEPGLFRLGDQSAVIASLAGDGIAIALASAARAAHCYLQGGAEAAADFQPLFAARARRPLRLANLLMHGGETPWIARPILALFAHAPGLIRQAAAMTRIGAG